MESRDSRQAHAPLFVGNFARLYVFTAVLGVIAVLVALYIGSVVRAERHRQESIGAAVRTLTANVIRPTLSPIARRWSGLIPPPPPIESTASVVTQ